MGNKPSPVNGDRRERSPRPNNEGGAEKMSYYKQAKLGYNELVNAIIRPPRAEYDETMLGPKHFELKGRTFKRSDLELRNHRNQRLVCSHWMAQDQRDPSPCVVYLHGNSSCRLEALDCLDVLLSQGLSVFSFDFSGSGQSDGEYISLGWFERDDVSAVIDHLRQSGLVSTIGLWGRSMGAATALMFARRDPSIACLVLDSPFASLSQLAKELVENSNISVPRFALSLALKFIRNSVKSRAKFDINKLEPIKYCDSSYIPALFGAAEHDSFIPPHHAQTLHDHYAGDKNLIIVDGNHNTKRGTFFFTSVSIFLHETLVKPSGGNGNAQMGEIGHVAGFRQYAMPSPLGDIRVAGARTGIGSEVDICLAKTAMVDEDEELLMQALELSRIEYEEAQKKKEKSNSFSLKKEEKDVEEVKEDFVEPVRVNPPTQPSDS